jgi:hypothetical protein
MLILMQPAKLLGLFLPFYFFLSACSLPRPHLHDSGDLKTAQDAQTTFNSFREGSQSPYEVMLRNARTVDQRLAEQQARAAKLKIDAVARALPDKTWGQINSDTVDRLAALEERNDESDKIAANLLRDLDDSTRTQDQTNQDLKALQAELEDAVREENLWNARGVLFRESLIEISQLAGSDKLDRDTLKDAGTRILDTKITTKELSPTQPGAVTEKEASIGDVLEPDLKAALRDARSGGIDASGETLGRVLRSYTVDTVDPDAAPGLTVAMLSLAIDLANIQRDRQKQRIVFIQQALTIMPSDPMARYRLRQISTSIAGLPQNERIIETLNSLDRARRNSNSATANQAAGQLRGAARILALYFAAVTTDESRALEQDARMALLRHEYSIYQSKLNAREREAVISRGLGALVTYQQGGIKPEQISQIISAAQAVGIAFIAAGVN